MKTMADLRLKPRRRNPYSPPTLEQIAEFEEAVGVTLPPSFKEYMLMFNGGLPDGKLIYRTREGEVGRINDFYGLGLRPKIAKSAEKGWEYGNLWEETRIMRPFVGANGIPFARDGGGNQMFLDFDKAPPSVGYLSAATRQRRVVFPSFNDVAAGGGLGPD